MIEALSYLKAMHYGLRYVAYLSRCELTRLKDSNLEHIFLPAGVFRMFSQLHSLEVDQPHRSSHLPPYPKDSPAVSAPILDRNTGWRGVWQQASQGLAQRSQLSIEKKSNLKGETWWQVSDPCSGKAFYAQTLNEAIHWIEVQRLG